MTIFKISDKIEVRKSNTLSGKGVFAISNIKKDEVLIDIEEKITKKPTNYTLQINKSEFLVANCIDNCIDNFINHSCNPNIFVRFHKNNKKRISYIALKNIRKKQELFWNYNTTEWDLVTKFTCFCNSKNCTGQISGMKYLTKNQRNDLLPLLSPYIKMKIGRRI